MHFLKERQQCRVLNPSRQLWFTCTLLKTGLFRILLCVQVSGYSGNAGDSLTGDMDHNGKRFSTRDKVNTDSGRDCANEFKGM